MSSDPRAGRTVSAMNDDLIGLLKELVAIDSVNPSLVRGASGEAQIAAFVNDWARSQGLGVAVLDVPAGRPSVLVRSRAQGNGPTLMLCGHLDTVGFGTMTNPLKPRVDGDRLYGRGTYDMKSGLAASLIACREADRAGLSGSVAVAAVADEEHSSVGIQAVLPHVIADAAIVTEPTELAVATGHRGFVWIEIEIVGKAAHGSRPHLGVDAIIKTGPVLVALDKLNTALRANQHPTLGPGVLHASLIAGGTEESTIPDRCVLTVERRTLPGETVQDVEKEVGDLLAECRRDDAGLVANLRTTLSREPFETSSTATIVSTLADAVGDVLGKPAEIGGVSYWADSAFISAAGIPTVVFGPPGDGAHAEVEWVSIDGTIDCAQALFATAQRFCE
jgi:acetylornithine deacetylase/succinyl-diaminopimelate desuccinylase family protein